MNQKIIDWTETTLKKYPFKTGRVLDVGSLNVNGTVKHLFKDCEEYIGIDFRDGKDVDIVMNGHDLNIKFPANSFDTIVCMNMLEHDNYFWESLEAMNDVLKKGGYSFIAIPTFGFPIHDHPQDYWRASEDAFKDIIFQGYELLELETVYTKTDDRGKSINPIICGFGRKL